MAARFEIRPPKNRNEALAYGWTVLHSLSPVAQPTLDRVEAFIDRTGTSGIRVATRGGEVLAGLVLLPMGQFYGGRSVPMTGVSAVAVSPEHRGTGVGTALMRAALREMSRHRVALSTLYPATQPIYRRLGWEMAGSRAQWRVPTRALALGDRRPPVRRLLAEDRAALHACHHEWARRRPGSLDRGDWAWRRVLESPDEEVRAHVVEGPRRRGAVTIEGYVVATRVPQPGMRSELQVRDLVALTPRAQRRLMTFLGDHRSIAPTTTLWCGPGDAAWILPDEQERALVADWRWMTRVVDVPAAMEARGFPTGMRLEVSVGIEDAQLPRNSGTWTLSCAGGRGTARRLAGAAPRATLHVRGLASIFTGHASADEAAIAGLASGDDEALAALTAMFAGPAPFTPEMW